LSSRGREGPVHDGSGRRRAVACRGGRNVAYCARSSARANGTNDGGLADALALSAVSRERGPHPVRPPDKSRPPQVTVGELAVGRRHRCGGTRSVSGARMLRSEVLSAGRARIATDASVIVRCEHARMARGWRGGHRGARAGRSDGRVYAAAGARRSAHVQQYLGYEAASTARPRAWSRQPASSAERPPFRPRSQPNSAGPRRRALHDLPSVASWQEGARRCRRWVNTMKSAVRRLVLVASKL